MGRIQRAMQGQEPTGLVQARRGEECHGGLERAVRPDPGVGPQREGGAQQSRAVPAPTVLRVHHALHGPVLQHADVTGQRALVGRLGRRPTGVIGAVTEVDGRQQMLCGASHQRETCRFVQRADPVVGGDRIEQVTDGVMVGGRESVRRDHGVLPGLKGVAECAPDRRALVDCHCSARPTTSVGGDQETGTEC